MYTQCPECGVAFRVTAEVLKQAAGKVRCGGCGIAFNALAHLSEEKPQAPAPTASESKLPELTPEEPPELKADDAPKTISAEQSAALLKTLDELAGEDIRIEDTGVEWRVVGNDEGDETADIDEPRPDDGDSPVVQDLRGDEDLIADTGSLKFVITDDDAGDADVDELLEESPTPVDQFLTETPPQVDAPEIFEEMRFDDNTPLPEDFDLDAPSPSPQPVVEPPEPEPVEAFEDAQVDLELGEPDDWEDLLDEVEEPPGEPGPEAEFEVEETAEALEEAVAESAADEFAAAGDEASDEPLDVDTQFAIQAEAMGIDLSGLQKKAEAEDVDDGLEETEIGELEDEAAETTIEEDLIAAAFETEAAAREQASFELEEDAGEPELDEVAEEPELPEEEPWLEEVAEEAEPPEDEPEFEEIAEAPELAEEEPDFEEVAEAPEFPEEEPEFEEVAEEPELPEEEPEFEEIAEEPELAEEEPEFEEIAEEPELAEEEPAAAEVDIADEMAIELDVVDEDESELLDEFREEPVDEQSLEIRLDEVEPDSGEHYVPEMTEEEKTINMMIDQDLLSIAVEDEDGFASTIVQVQPSKKVEDEIESKEEAPEKEEEPEADAEAEKEAAPKAKKKKKEAVPLVETIIMEGESILGEDHEEKSEENRRLGAEIKARQAEEDLMKSESGRASRIGMIAAAVLLALVLILQFVHQSREALATNPAFNDAVGPVYRMLGKPLTPSWDIKGWRFEATKGSTDETEQMLTIYSRVGNQSDTALPYPLVHVSLTDRFEDIVGSRVLEPGEYLGSNADPRELVPAGNTFNAVISIESPAAEATGFKLNVCYRLAGGQLRCAIEDFK